MMRVQNWESKLHAFIEARSNMPFEWGQNDCCLFVADAVALLTGNDFTKDWRGKYKTEAGAAKRLAKKGGIDGVVNAALGEAYDNALFAKRGDVVMINGSNGDFVAICVGASAVAVTHEGLSYFPMARAFKAWKV